MNPYRCPDAPLEPPAEHPNCERITELGRILDDVRDTLRTMREEHDSVMDLLSTAKVITDSLRIEVEELYEVELHCALTRIQEVESEILELLERSN